MSGFNSDGFFGNQGQGMQQNQGWMNNPQSSMGTSMGSTVNSSGMGSTSMTSNAGVGWATSYPQGGCEQPPWGGQSNYPPNHRLPNQGTQISYPQGGAMNQGINYPPPHGLPNQGTTITYPQNNQFGGGFNTSYPQ